MRLYRAEDKSGSQDSVPDWVKQSEDYQRSQQASGRWFTDDLSEAEWYIEHEYPSGKIVCVDVPDETANNYRVSKLEKAGGKSAAENPFVYSLRPEKEFFLPREIANQKRDYEKLEHKKGKNLAGKVISLLFLAGGIFLVLSSLRATGFVIVSTIRQFPSMAGLLLFSIGIVGIVSFNRNIKFVKIN